MKRKLSITVGIFWVTFLIYRLIILQRIPYFISANISIVRIMIILAILSMNIIEVYKLYQLYKGKQRNGWLSVSITKVITVVYWEPLGVIETSLRRIRIVKILIKYINVVMLKYLTSITRLKTLIIIFTIIPRSVVGISLLYDVLNQRVELMYTMIGILIIPISLNIVLKMTINENKRLKEELEVSSVKVIIRDDNYYIKGITKDKVAWEKAYNVIDIINAIDITKENRLIIALRILSVSIYIIAWQIVLISVLYYKIIIYIGNIAVKNYIKRKHQERWKNNI